MDLGGHIANRLETVKPVDDPLNRLLTYKIPNLYPNYDFQGSKLSNGVLKIYEKSLLYNTGTVEENNNPTRLNCETEEDIFQVPFKSEQNFSNKCSGEVDSRDEFFNYPEHNSLKIRYPLNEEITQYHVIRTISNKNTPSINPTPNLTPLYHRKTSNRGLRTKLEAPPSSELKKLHSRTSGKATAVKSGIQSPTLNDESSNFQPKCKGYKSSREKGEFGATINVTFPKAYKPSYSEKEIYHHWEENGYFKPKNDHGDKFSMILPPPNVTGTLHLGHAITLAIQDALARWHRMEGKNVVWIPGLDHAGIATQTVVERWLKKNKQLSRHDIGEENFLKEVMYWKNEKGKVINEQLRKFGASLDWSREIFTMDQRHNEVVVEAIVRLWNAGLVYRKESLINWSCDLRSAISDIEVERLDISGPTPIQVPGYDKPVMFGELMEIAYKVCDSEEEVVVATTRPETMLGDVAVAVHPRDKRYTHLHGQKVWHPLRRTAIPIITDQAVDMRFGTGAVKITPGHSLTDWDIAQRHKLPMLSVIDGKGHISTGDYDNMFKDMKRFDARDRVKQELTKLGLWRGVRPHSMKIPICSRSGDVVEYLLKYQWFVSCKSMAEKAAMAVRAGLIQIEPPNYNNTWFTFLDNIRDWCISRQLWWGHRIPMYHATAGHKSVWVAAPSQGEAVARAELELGAKVDTITQDPDVLDTWFSSALCPLSALGWPKQTDDLKRYYPLDLMETGHDILFFWVARMVMLGVELTGELPFKKVLLHGIICDAMGRKMSKSLGNVINPEDVIYGKTLEDLKLSVLDNFKAGLMSNKEKDLALKGQEKLFPNGIPECGTDALRFTLLSHKTKNHLISFDVRECETNRFFLNKVWQASRFSLHWAGTLGIDNSCEPQNPNLMDRWILSQLSRTVEEVTAGLQSADLHFVTAAIKDFLYYKLCDYYMEAAKPILKEGSDAEAHNTCHTLLYCLDVGLRLASPIIPFISEHLYKHLPGHHDQSCMLANFPSQMEKWRDPKLDSKVELGIEIISAIRNLKCTNVFYTKHVPVELETHKKDEISELKSFIEVLANCNLEIVERTGRVRKQTLTNIVEDHSLVHISLKNISKEQYEEYAKTLVKKEAKIRKTLDKIVEKTKKEGYIKTDKEVKLKVEEQIRTLEEELKSVQAYMEVNKPV